MMANNRGKEIRHRLLRYFMDKEHTSSFSVMKLDDIARELRLPEQEIIDQLDILDSQGEIEANRTSGGTAARLTGMGKLTLEKLDGEAKVSGRSTKKQRARSLPTKETFQWDAFICHASEDKDTFVRLLANELMSQGIRIWYDEFTLRIGDSLRRSIDEGLKKSHFGIVVLSHAFFAKEWPQKELDGLVVRERNGQWVILPVWLNVSVEDVARYSLPLVDRVAAKANEGLDKVVAHLLSILRPNSLKQEDMSKPDKKRRKVGGDVPKIAQSVKSPTNSQPTTSTQLPTVFTYSDRGLVNTPPFDIGTSPWKLRFSTNWSGHFAVQLRNDGINLIINQRMTADAIYETYVYGHTGRKLYFSIQNAPVDGVWMLSVIKVT